jgi:hypothetical protein
MRCFVCARSGTNTDAVAICPHCGAGLCMKHVAVAAQDPGPGGMRLSCPHETWDSVSRETVWASRS